MEWQQIFIDIEDRLFPYFELSIYERGMYLYLLNKTRIRGCERITVPLAVISEALKCSEWQSRRVIRDLADKGLIDLEQTRKGHSVKVLLPTELNIPKSTEQERITDIEKIDFFSNRDYVESLIEREQGTCFYCLSDITPDNCELDHVTSLLNRGDNSYKNIVAACHKCNTRKLAMSAEDFLRSLYRKGILSEKELEDRFTALESLRLGGLKPEI